MATTIPIGVTASFQNVPAGAATAVFGMDAGQAVVTFQALDRNNPGVVTLYDSGNNVKLTMNAEGYSTFYVPTGGARYYFSTTAGAKALAMTHPSVWR
jgi:hypothetical protein